MIPSMISTLEEVRSKGAGRRLVLTNGVFDVLHSGHVTYLRAAKALGDVLVVGVNSDESARRLGKGPHRPVNGVEARALVLSELRSVDFVVVFEEDTAVVLVQALRPDVYVKGGDYTVETLPEASSVLAYGGEVVIQPLLPGHSTTRILRELGKE